MEGLCPTKEVCFVAKYILKRVLRSAITMLIITVIVFSLLRLMPIEGYFENYDKLSQTQIDVKLRDLGLKDPLPVQLWNYIKQVFQGDLGESNVFRKGVAITEIVAEKIPISLQMGLISLAIALALGLPLGIMMARSTRTRWKLWDKFGTIFIVIVQAVPAAAYHILIQFAGSQGSLHLPMLFKAGRPAQLYTAHLFSGYRQHRLLRHVLRRYMVDESNKDYIRLARAKGLPSGAISRRHMFRNAMVPLIQYIPNSILFTLMGSLYVESLYSIPGMGGLLVTVIKRQDNTMVVALVLIYAAISILGLLFGDILMAILDPRISFTKKEGRALMKRYKDHKTEQLAGALEERLKEQLSQTLQGEDAPSAEAAATGLSDKELFSFAGFDASEAERGGYSNYSYWRRRCGCSSKTASPCSSSSSWF